MVRHGRRNLSSSDSRPVGAKRGVLLAGLFFVWVLAIVLRLYDLQIIQYVELLARADRQQQRTVEIAPKRGIIYDRNMHPLAMSLAVDSVYAVPSNIPDPSMEAKLLAPILNLDEKDLETRFQAHNSFCWVKRKITNQQSARIRDLNLQGIYFQKEMKRFYPDGDLASTVLGYVGMDDNGLGGVEYQYNKQIRGLPGRVLLSTDARHRSFRSTDWRGKAGKNVVLTIDEDIQYIAEKALEQTVQKFHAAGGTVIVQNPHTGDILAMANEPTFNPNGYQKFPPKDRINRAIGWIYEPGSTFKSVTVSSAIDENLAKPTDLIDCQMGQIKLGGRIIHDVHDILPYERKGPLTLAQVLMYSSDVGAVKMGLRLGDERFYHRILEYGFDSETGVGLPGEEDWAAGISPPLVRRHDWPARHRSGCGCYSAANGPCLFCYRERRCDAPAQNCSRNWQRGRRWCAPAKPWPTDYEREHRRHDEKDAQRCCFEGLRSGCATGRIHLCRENWHCTESGRNGPLFAPGLCSFFYRFCSCRKACRNHSGGYRYAGWSNLRGRSGSSGVEDYRRTDTALSKCTARQSFRLNPDRFPPSRRISFPEQEIQCGKPSSNQH